MNYMKKQDIILITGLLIAAAVVTLGFRLFTRNGEKAVVTLDGTVILEQPLQEDCDMPIRSENGENVLRIENGKVRITEADCRDQICVNHKEISKAGESIVCLPHGLVVEIKR